MPRGAPTRVQEKRKKCYELSCGGILGRVRRAQPAATSGEAPLRRPGPWHNPGTLPDAAQTLPFPPRPVRHPDKHADELGIAHKPWRTSVCEDLARAVR